MVFKPFEGRWSVKQYDYNYGLPFYRSIHLYKENFAHNFECFLDYPFLKSTHALIFDGLLSLSMFSG